MVLFCHWSCPWLPCLIMLVFVRILFQRAAGYTSEGFFRISLRVSDWFHFGMVWDHLERFSAWFDMGFSSAVLPAL